MSSQDPEKGVLFRVNGAMHTQDGPLVDFTAIPSEGTTLEEAREIIADAHGIAPGAVQLGDAEMRRTAAGRISVGFSKWNSSWDPDAEREKGVDPTLN